MFRNMAKTTTRTVEFVHLWNGDTAVELGTSYDMLSREVERLRREIVELKGRIRFFGFGMCHCRSEQDPGHLETPVSKADGHTTELESANITQDERKLKTLERLDEIDEHIEGGNPISPPPKKPDQDLHSSTEAAALLNAMCQEIQNKMYEQVLPNLYVPTRNYKIKNLKYDLEKFPQSSNESVASVCRWEKMRVDFDWNESDEMAIEALRQSGRGAGGSQQLTKRSLVDAGVSMENDGSLKGWLSLGRISKVC